MCQSRGTTRGYWTCSESAEYYKCHMMGVTVTEYQATIGSWNWIWLPQVYKGSNKTSVLRTVLGLALIVTLLIFGGVESNPGHMECEDMDKIKDIFNSKMDPLQELILSQSRDIQALKNTSRHWRIE